MIEKVVAFIVFLPIAISLILLSLRIRKEHLYGTDHDVFGRNMFSRKDLSQISAKRDTDKH